MVLHVVSVTFRDTVGILGVVLSEVSEELLLVLYIMKSIARIRRWKI